MCGGNQWCFHTLDVFIARKYRQRIISEPLATHIVDGKKISNVRLSTLYNITENWKAGGLGWNASRPRTINARTAFGAYQRPLSRCFWILFFFFFIITYFNNMIGKLVGRYVKERKRARCRFASGLHTNNKII